MYKGGLLRSLWNVFAFHRECAIKGDRWNETNNVVDNMSKTIFQFAQHSSVKSNAYNLDNKCCV